MFEKLIESSKQRKRGRTGRYFLVTCLVYAVTLTAFGVMTILWFDPSIAEAFSVVAIIEPPPPLGNSSPPAARPQLATTNNPTSYSSAPPKTPLPILPPGEDFRKLVSTNVGVPCVPPCAAGNGVEWGVIGAPPLTDGAPPPPPKPIGTPRPDPPPTPTPAPTPAPTPVKPVLMTSQLLQGNAINKAQPPYPEIAKRAGAHGPVQVQVMISEDGRVLTAEILSGHVLLRDVSRQAALQWRFKPTVLNGVAVPVTGVITFDFKLNR